MARDVANLKRDDAKLSAVAKRHGLPDWDTWWPTLEELRDGAKAARGAEDRPRVTVVVHTGGEADTWTERSAYLRRSLESLDARVTGPIVQRVVYADWGPEHRAELVDIAEEFGFYVVGDGHHGYSGSMGRMWSYLNRRAIGDWIFSAEDDFTYDRDVDLEPMIETLRDNPNLRQLALLRAAYYPREIEAGGVLESLTTPVELQNHRAYPFVEHRDHFTANPSLFHKALTATPWPNSASSERAFGDLLLRDKAARFAYWGSGEAWITHIGAVRAGTAY
jgi:hypothetical protein